MVLNAELEQEIKKRGADFVHFVDVSQLAVEQNKGYPSAILLGIILSPDYIQKITNTTNYVPQMILNNQVIEDEFHMKEIEADRLADYFTRYLSLKGYSAYSQSEDNIELTGFYNENTKSTPLPHKTVALLAGLGWIGKHNLLVTPEYGSAICMCTILTDAPLKTVLNSLSDNQCGSCNICENICQVKAIKGNTWESNISRDEMVDVYKCNSCIECLVFCPWTQTYMKNKLKLHL